MFTITIETDNAAFQNGNRNAEIARILLDYATNLLAGGDIDMRLHDENGNTVGSAEIELSLKEWEENK